MPRRNFSGMDYDITVGDRMIHVESSSISVTDNGTVGLSQGIPNGWVTGSFAAEGQMVLDTMNAKVINELAKQHGSYMDIPPFDMVFFAGDNDFSEKIEVFGVKIKVNEIHNGESAGGSKLTKSFQLAVTSPDFIHIDGVPIIAPRLTEGISI